MKLNFRFLEYVRGYFLTKVFFHSQSLLGFTQKHLMQVTNQLTILRLSTSERNK